MTWKIGHQNMRARIPTRLSRRRPRLPNFMTCYSCATNKTAIRFQSMRITIGVAGAYARFLPFAPPRTPPYDALSMV